MTLTDILLTEKLSGPEVLLVLLGIGGGAIGLMYVIGWGLKKTAEAVSDVADSKAVLDLRYGKEFRDKVLTLLDDFVYFRRLSPGGKEKFIDRVVYHYSKKEFEGENGYEPDEKIRIHICATAAQLTFGMSKDWLTGIETIRLYPENFRLYAGGPLMKGATSPSGTLFISVKDYEEGYRNGSDNFNVGLHEFGHQLFIEFLTAAKEDDAVKQVLFPYDAEAEKELAKKDRTEVFLRKYAFTNRHEFFAVSIETFFESPVDFSHRLPELYRILSQMLNQDPRNSAADYAVQAETGDMGI
ncbi:MAG TPA: zinc-dependent peptidase [Bacteroidia bacterium]|nr:zinc-dependent peptidase [Bacteroidia bacterium]